MVRVQPSRRGRASVPPRPDARWEHPSRASRRSCVSYRRLLTLAGLFCGAFYSSRPGSAGEGFQPVTPAELRMTGELKSPGAPAIILFRQVDRDDNGNTSHEYNYLKIKILTEEGRKYADVEIPFFRSAG